MSQITTDESIVCYNFTHMTQQVLSRHRKLTKKRSPKFVSSQFLNLPMHSGHCKRFVAFCVRSPAFGFRTAPRPMDAAPQR